MSDFVVSHMSARDCQHKLDSWLRASRARVCVLYTPEHHQYAQKDERFRYAMSQADLVVASEGMSGSFLPRNHFLEIVGHLVTEKSLRVVVLAGPKQDPAEVIKSYAKASSFLKAAVGLRLEEGYHTIDHVTGHIIECLNQLSPDILLLSSEVYLQETWIADHRHRLNCSIVAAV